MHQQDSIDLIEKYYASFNAGDMETFLELLADDVIHDINQGKREIGREAFRQFMACMNNNYRETVTDLVVMATAAGQPRNLLSLANICATILVSRKRRGRNTGFRRVLFLPSGQQDSPRDQLLQSGRLDSPGQSVSEETACKRLATVDWAAELSSRIVLCRILYFPHLKI